MNGWSDLNEIWYLEGPCVSELLFWILTYLVILGELEGETENLGKRLDWRDWDHNSLRYVIDITGVNAGSLGELGGVNSEKLMFFNLRIDYRILMKFDV